MLHQLNSLLKLIGKVLVIFFLCFVKINLFIRQKHWCWLRGKLKELFYFWPPLITLFAIHSLRLDWFSTKARKIWTWCIWLEWHSMLKSVESILVTIFKVLQSSIHHIPILQTILITSIYFTSKSLSTNHPRSLLSTFLFKLVSNQFWKCRIRKMDITILSGGHLLNGFLLVTCQKFKIRLTSF